MRSRSIDRSAHDDGVVCALRHRACRAEVVKRDARRPHPQRLERKHLGPSRTWEWRGCSVAREGLVSQRESSRIKCRLPVISCRRIGEQGYREYLTLTHDDLLP